MILHPEKLLGTSSDRGLWAKRSMYSVEDILRKFLGLSRKHATDAALPMLRFLTTKKVIVVSESLVDAISAKTSKSEGVDQVFEAGRASSLSNVSACLLWGESTLYFELLRTELGFSVRYTAFKGSSEKLRALGIEYIERGWNSVGDDENARFATAVVTLIFSICVFREDPSIVDYSPKSRSASQKETPDQETPVSQGFTLPIEYITLASGRSRVAKTIACQVRGHNRKQRVGPGRMFVREVFVKGYSKGSA